MPGLGTMFLVRSRPANVDPVSVLGELWRGNDRVGPSAQGAAVVAARLIAAALLVPTASDSDRQGVPRGHLDALASAGLLGLPSAHEVWATGDPAPLQTREVSELIAAACGTTWFCWTQHRGPTDTVNAATTSGEAGTEAVSYAEPLRTGRALAGVAFAHLRRPGPPQVVAEEVAGGWRISGSLDWVTSFDIADVIAIAAVAPGISGGAMAAPNEKRIASPAPDRLVWVLIDAVAQPGIDVGPILELAAMRGTHTRPLRIDRLFIPAARVISVLDLASWLAADALRTPNASPPAFGVARAATTALEAHGEQRSVPPALAAADVLAERVRVTRSQAYQLIDQVPATEQIDQRLELRAAALELAVQASTAYVTACAGAAILLSHPAQRWGREAMFHLVQAQTKPVREASLRRYTLSAADVPAL